MYRLASASRVNTNTHTQARASINSINVSKTRLTILLSNLSGPFEILTGRRRRRAAVAFAPGAVSENPPHKIWF